MDPRFIRLTPSVGSINRPWTFVITDGSFTQTKEHLEILQQHIVELNESYVYVLSNILAQGNISVYNSDTEWLLKSRSEKLTQLIECKKRLQLIKGRLIQMEKTIDRLKSCLSRS